MRKFIKDFHFPSFAKGMVAGVFILVFLVMPFTSTLLKEE